MSNFFMKDGIKYVKSWKITHEGNQIELGPLPLTRFVHDGWGLAYGTIYEAALRLGIDIERGKNECH